jgi:hypothetical protein
MILHVKARAVAAVISVVAALAVALPGVAPAQRATTSPAYNYTIHVTITRSGVILSAMVAKRGWLAHFVIVNKSKQTHTFDIGGLKTHPLKPGAKGKLGAQLDARGQFPFKVDNKTKGYFNVV